MTKAPTKTAKTGKPGITARADGPRVTLDFTSPSPSLTPDEARALAKGLRAAADEARRNAVMLETDEQARKAWSLREKGKTLAEVAEALGTNVPTASRWAQRGRVLAEGKARKA